jgi:hypothetical protein
MHQNGNNKISDPNGQQCCHHNLSHWFAKVRIGRLSDAVRIGRLSDASQISADIGT